MLRLCLDTKKVQMRILYTLTFICVACFILAYYELYKQKTTVMLFVFWVVFIILIGYVFRKIIKTNI